MRIIICDDEPAMRNILSEKIRKIQSTDEVLTCASGEELLQMPRPDILFLDIQMPGQNGMETARAIRKKDKHMVLVFITALEEYVYEAFDVNAFHYLVKPFSDEKLEEVLRHAVESLEEQRLYGEVLPGGSAMKEAVSGKNESQNAENRCFYVKNGGTRIRIKIADIIYAEVFNRKIVLHTKDRDVEYYGKLGELEARAGEDFFRPHRAYLINMKYVVKYDAHTIWTERGSVIMSKKQFPIFVKRYLAYISREQESN